jgi:hypothetical protein
MNFDTDKITGYTDQELEDGFKALSNERKARAKKKKELKDLETLAAKHGKVIVDKVEPTEAAKAVKEIAGKPGEKSATAAPFKMT